MKRKEKEKKEETALSGEYGLDYDDDFANIIGFTSGGAPYGVTWSEAEQMKRQENVMRVR